MKRYKIWFILLLSLAIGCGNAQLADEEKQTENLTQTETQKQEGSVTEAPKRSEIVIQNSSTGQLPTPTPLPGETDDLVLVYDRVKGYFSDIAIADDGTLYAVCMWDIMKQGRTPKEITQPNQTLYAFDKDGACLWQMDLLFQTGELGIMNFGYSSYNDNWMVIEWYDGFLYTVVREYGETPVLYRLNLETWEWQELYRLEQFSQICYLVAMEDRLYVQGILKKPGEKELVQNPEHVDNYRYLYKGQAMGYLERENPDAGVTLLPIDVPREMIKIDEDTLGIYLTGDEAWTFYKYTPAQELWEKTDIGVAYYRSTVAEKDEKSPRCEKFCGYEDGCFYLKNYFLCYETEDGTEQLMVALPDNPPHYMQSDGTFLYYYTHVGAKTKIQRMEISKLFELKKE